MTTAVSGMRRHNAVRLCYKANREDGSSSISQSPPGGTRGEWRSREGRRGGSNHRGESQRCCLKRYSTGWKSDRDQPAPVPDPVAAGSTQLHPSRAPPEAEGNLGTIPHCPTSPGRSLPGNQEGGPMCGQGSGAWGCMLIPSRQCTSQTTTW
ncbi:hypothetical protein ANANG_G00160780 [Anguilla anguilla]|uniref:Uncharacterized protein n=1 Tax=Anguilla anguilla TaxID=7936 RepID=A0A9D3MA40_ANGAN|nr:hypothetical protein ANANG_G00160780 [Anguilla anguilla]